MESGVPSSLAASPAKPIDVTSLPRHTSFPKLTHRVCMKLDYDLLAATLEHIEATGDGQKRQRVSHDDLSELSFACDSFDAFAYHFDLLATDGFINGRAERLAYRGDKPIIAVDYFGLTLRGHELLDSVRNEGVWTAIVSTAKALGVGGLKQTRRWLLPPSRVANAGDTSPSPTSKTRIIFLPDSTPLRVFGAVCAKRDSGGRAGWR